MDSQLTDRERTVLRLVVDRFISTGEPVGSRFVARSSDLGLSPASIRNTMSDLEERGYLGHPHTSAGRIPTESGYRLYVDELMQVEAPRPGTQQLLSRSLDEAGSDIEELVRRCARLLGELSSLLGVVLTPRFESAILHRLDIVPVSSDKALFVLSVESGLVKTLIVEIESELKPAEIQGVVSLLNERLSGLTFSEIRDTLALRVDADTDHTGLISVILKEASVIFSDLPQHRRLSYSGTEFIIGQPEFSEPDAMRGIISLLESRDSVIRVLESQDEDGNDDVRVYIGTENATEELSEYSLVRSIYRVGNVSGSVGLIGPMRMNYSRAVGLVWAAANEINRTES